MFPPRTYTCVIHVRDISVAFGAPWSSNTMGIYGTNYWTNIFFQGLGLPYGPESGQFLNGNLWITSLQDSCFPLMDLYDIFMISL